ncbi:MAG TPA: winged helix-turn-helix domain-containing protein [Anaerohalosphaeraceae bacterium]|nr:winged helix-turn-helix domain-containing protein [Anaerohalosphaeraceae bacterium]
MTQNEINAAIQSLKDWLINQTETPEYKQRGGIRYQEAQKLKTILDDLRDRLPHLSFNNDSLRSRLDDGIKSLVGGEITELESGFSMLVNSGFQPKELMIEYLTSKIEPIIKTLDIYREHLASTQVSNQPQTGVGFQFLPGQVFFNGNTINVSVGRQYEILKTLADNFGKVVSFNTLDSTCVSIASEQLRTDISEIRKALKSAETPLIIKSVRTEGYILTTP